MNWGETLDEVLAQKDSLISEIESLVKMPKEAAETIPKRRRDKVPNELVLRVKVLDKHSIKLKLSARNVGGQWFMRLQKDNGDILREYHYQYEGHPNPNKKVISGYHKHFPTQKYPLSLSHKDNDTWAYNLENFPVNFLEAVRDFCIECNIKIEGVQERLNPGWL